MDTQSNIKLIILAGMGQAYSKECIFMQCTNNPFLLPINLKKAAPWVRIEFFWLSILVISSRVLRSNRQLAYILLQLLYENLLRKGSANHNQAFEEFAKIPCSFPLAQGLIHIS
jgi:hypothetical protein